jgi:anti-sigma factor RsiW
MQGNMDTILTTRTESGLFLQHKCTIMICNKAKVLMSAAIDGELTAKESSELEEHLSECPDCQAEFQEARNTKIIIRQRLVRVQAPKSLRESIERLANVTT